MAEASFLVGRSTAVYIHIRCADLGDAASFGQMLSSQAADSRWIVSQPYASCFNRFDDSTGRGNRFPPAELARPVAPILWTDLWMNKS
jgi:hypothetical protein